MNCLHCNQPIISKRNTKKYCSNTCKQYAYMQRTGSVGMVTELKNEISLVSQENEQPENFNENEKATVKMENDSGYKKIRPKLLSKLDDSSFHVHYLASYFSTNHLGSIRPENFQAFGFVCKRIRCIVENLFLLCYKRKVHYKTIHFLRRALEETLSSAHYKQLPSDFPLTDDLLDLFKQLGELERELKGNSEGIKFTLEKKSVVHYLNMIRAIRGFVLEKQAFQELFPHFFKG